MLRRSLLNEQKHEASYGIVRYSGPMSYVFTYKAMAERSSVAPNRAVRPRNHSKARKNIKSMAFS